MNQEQWLYEQAPTNMNQDWFEYSQSLDGWMYPEELRWLYAQAQSRPIIVEIGIWKGRSTSALCAACPGHVYAIDHWLGSPEERATYHAALTEDATRELVIAEARRNLSRFQNLTILELSSEAALPKLLELLGGRKIDLLFLDGGHDYRSVADNINAYDRYVADNGMVAGHDYKPEFPGVIKASYDAYGFEVCRGPGSLWYVPF